MTNASQQWTPAWNALKKTFSHCVAVALHESYGRKRPGNEPTRSRVWNRLYRRIIVKTKAIKPAVNPSLRVTKRAFPADTIGAGFLGSLRMQSASPFAALGLL